MSEETFNLNTSQKHVVDWLKAQEKHNVTRSPERFAQFKTEFAGKLSQLELKVPNQAPDATTLFYSGKADHLNAWQHAEPIGKASNGKIITIGQTELGKMANDVDTFQAALKKAVDPKKFPHYSAEVTKDIWDNASTRLAQEAKGRVYTITPNAQADKVYATKELPVLLNNPKVSHIDDLKRADLLQMRIELGKAGFTPKDAHDAVQSKVSVASAAHMDAKYGIKPALNPELAASNTTSIKATTVVNEAQALRINKVVKGMGVAGTVYGVGMGVLDVKQAVDAAKTPEEKWRVGGQQGADVATRGVVTGVAAAVCAVPGAIGGTAAGAAAGTLVAPGPGTVGGGIAGGVAGGVAAGGACAVVAEKLYEGSALQKGVQYVGEKAGELGHQLNNYLFSDDKAGMQNPQSLLKQPNQLEQQKTNALGDRYSLNTAAENERILSKPLHVNASLQDMNAYAFAALLSDDPKVTSKGLDQVFNSHQGIEGMRLVEQFGVAHEQQQLQLLAQNQAQEVKSPSRSISM
jgi:hypothetical protein